MNLDWSNVDWTNLQAYVYIGAGGVALAVIAGLLYLIPGARLKVPTIVGASLGCLAAGIAGGVLLMVGFGYRIGEIQPLEEDIRAAAMNPGEPMAMGGMRGNMGGRRPGQGGGRGGFGRFAPSPRSQLVSLVAKLDLLLQPKPLQVGPELKTKLAEQLNQLAQAKELSEEEAQKRLNALLELLSDHKEALQAVGYRWPGQRRRGFGQPAESANPFHDQEAAAHLKSVRDALSAPANQGS